MSSEKKIRQSMQLIHDIRAALRFDIEICQESYFTSIYRKIFDI